MRDMTATSLRHVAVLSAYTATRRDTRLRTCRMSRCLRGAFHQFKTGSATLAFWSADATPKPKPPTTPKERHP